MTEIVDCLPARAKAHFINLRNMRMEDAISRYQSSLRDLRSQMAARGIGRSSIQMTQEWTLSEKLSNEMAKDHVEGALDTCRLYDIPLTRQLCDCILNASEEFLRIKFEQTVSTQRLRSSEMTMPPQAQQQFESMASNRRYGIMPEIRVMIETARVEDEKKRIAIENERGKLGDTYNQYITQRSGVMNASQTGDVSAQQITVSDLETLHAALAQMRAFFKQQDSLDADEYADPSVRRSFVMDIKDRRRLASALNS